MQAGKQPALATMVYVTNFLYRRAGDRMFVSR
jgi:hypothetical protein